MLTTLNKYAGYLFIITNLVLQSSNLAYANMVEETAIEEAVTPATTPETGKTFSRIAPDNNVVILEEMPAEEIQIAPIIPDVTTNDQNDQGFKENEPEAIMPMEITDDTAMPNTDQQLPMDTDTATPTDQQQSSTNINQEQPPITNFDQLDFFQKENQAQSE